MRLNDFKVLSFDCYGTLIDWEAGLIAGLRMLTDRLSPPPGRDKVLETYAGYESAAQRQTPAKRYSEVLAVVYRRLAEEWGLAVDWEECRAFGRSIGDWPPFPDSAGALAYLKRHYRLAILSNVDNAGFAASNARLQVGFDAVYTAEDIGSYKPSPRNFDYLLHHLAQRGFAKGQVLHVAQSLFHDHAPANGCGLASCWIDRRHGQPSPGATLQPDSTPRCDFSFNSLADFVEAHREEVGG